MRRRWGCTVWVVKPGRLQITFDCHDPASLGTFWALALGYPKPDVDGWHSSLRSQVQPEDPDGIRPRLFLQRVPEPKSRKNRVHVWRRLIQHPDRFTPLR